MTIQTAVLTTSAANIYVSTGNTAITSLTLCNYSAGNVTANLFVVPAGNSASTSNQMWHNLPLVTGDTYQIYAAAEKILLGPGDTIQANCSNATAVTTITSFTSI
jgi:hypothetical protein